MHRTNSTPYCRANKDPGRWFLGGATATKTEMTACQVSITGKHLVIRDPAADYAVVKGPILDDECAAQYGDAIVTASRESKPPAE